MAGRFAALLCLIAVCACTKNPPAPSPPSPPSFDAGVARTPARQARGEYLVNGILWCLACHTERDADQPGQPLRAGRIAAGAIFDEHDGKRLVAPNLTPDPQTGAARWSDAQLARAIRQGIGHDGRRLRTMPWQGFASLSDEDLAAVIVFLRSLPAVRNALPPSLPAAAADDKLASQPLIAVPAREMKTPVERGRYLVALADCAGCHTSWYSPRMPGLFAGGNLIRRLGRETFSANITPDATGVGYGAEAFIQVMRTGKFGTLAPAMPWVAYRNLTDDDLRAIYAALLTVPPAAHIVANQAEPTYCAVCGQKHGGGAQNSLVLPKAIALAPAVLDRYVGTYHNDPFDLTVTIRREGDRLLGQAGQWAFELIAQSETEFLAPGYIAPLRFELGPDGRALRMAEIGLDPAVYERRDAPPAPAGK